MINKILILCAAVLVISVSVLAYVKPGQARQTSIASAALTTDAAQAEREIRAILEKYYEIARTNDREALKNYSRTISAPEYRYSSELGMLDKAATFELLDSQAAEFLTTGFDDLTIQVYGDTAVAKYRDVSQFRANGETLKKQTRFTNFWARRESGRWQIVAEHSSVIKPPQLLPRHPLAERLAQK